VYGPHLECVWASYVICVGLIYDMCGPQLCVDLIYNMCGPHLGYMWTSFRTCFDLVYVDTNCLIF